jgi:hypothetical protein
MSEIQLTFVLASLPTMITVLIGILVNNSRLSDVRTDMNSLKADMKGDMTNLRADVTNLRADMNGLKGDMNLRLGEFRTDMNRQFSDSREIWRSELHRVEEILDARLKHLEERH